MADEQEVKLDASQLISEMAKMQAAFRAHAESVGQVANTYIQMNKTADGISGTFKQVTQDGLKVTGFFKEQDKVLQAHVKSVSQVQSALSKLREEQARLAQAGAKFDAQALFKEMKIPEAIPLKNLGPLQAAQKQLISALAKDIKDAGPVAQEILNDLQKGVVTFETGVRRDIQAALIRVLNIQQRITAEIKKQQDLNKPADPAKVNQGQLNILKGNLQTVFRVPDGASLSAVQAFHNAMQGLIAVAARGKVEYSQLINIFNAIKANPNISVAANLDETKVENASRRVVAAHRQMIASAKALEEQGKRTGNSLFVSFEQFVKILEIQLIHRAFGALITGMQASVQTAAQLQVSISEIRTVSQSAGIGFTDLQARIRSVSEEFNRPQVDVAEALYQGFSNQVIKTAGDLHVLNEVMRLSRITASTAANAMEAYTSVVNSYRIGNEQAREVTSELFKAVEIGRFRLDDIAGSLGRVTVVGSQLGATRTEILGLMASLTRNGVPAAEAMTQISGIMQGLLKPTDGMKNLFRQWGVETGFAAVQTFGFVNVLQRLFQEAQRGNADLAALFPNVRAFRGVLGATAGGGTGELAGDVAQIEQARASADRAVQIISESAGERFLSELNKIRNFFLNDFANSFIQTAEKLAAPFGGISNAVKQFGGAVIDVAGHLSNIASNMTQIITLGGVLGGNIGTLVKLYLIYKGSIIALNLAQQICQAITAQLAAIELTRSANLGFIAANTVATTAATGGLTFSMVAATVATRAWALALTALPFVAIIGGLVALGYALTATNRQMENDINRMGQVSEEIRRNNERERDQTRAAQSRETREFGEQLQQRVRGANRAVAEVTRGLNELAESQNQALTESTERLKLATDAVAADMRRILQRINQDISDAQNNIERSRRNIGSFADRESARSFQAALEAAGKEPKFLTGLRPLTDPNQIRAEQIQRQGRLNSLTEQQRLIQERIAELQQGVGRDQARGDEQSIESARRKLEEIRRLTQQQWQLETQESEERTTNAAIDLARRTGQNVTATYEVNQERLRQLMATIRQQEEAMERSHIARQEAIIARGEQERRVQEERNRQYEQSVRALTALRTTNQQGELKPEFQGARGLRNFEAEFDRLAERVRQAARESGVTGQAMADLELRLSLQRVSARAAAETEITRIHATEVQRRIETERAAIAQLRQAGDEQRDRAQEQVRQAREALPGQIADLQRNIQAMRQFMDWNPASDRNVRFEVLMERFRREREAVLATNRELETAQGEQKDIIAARLERQTRELAETYRRMLRLSAGENVLPGTNITGNDAARQRLDIETSARRIIDANADLRQAITTLEEAERRSRAFADELNRVEGPLGAIARQIGTIGEAAGGQRGAISGLATDLNNLNRELERLRGNAGVRAPNVMGPAAPQGQGNVVPIGGGGGGFAAFAEGGLIGGRFTGRGPDNRLIFAKDGEMVVNAESTRKFYSTLVAINAGRMPKHYAAGGVVSNSNFGDVNISVDGSRSPSVTARAISRELKRERRRGTGG